MDFGVPQKINTFDDGNDIYKYIPNAWIIIGSQFNGQKVKLKFICGRDHIFVTKAKDIKEGKWCKECFIENKEGGSIYNHEVIKIGEVKNGEFILYK